MSKDLEMPGNAHHHCTRRMFSCWSVFFFFTATVCELRVVGFEGKYSSSTCKCEVLVKHQQVQAAQQEGDRRFSCVRFLVLLLKLLVLGETVWIIMLVERPYITSLNAFSSSEPVQRKKQHWIKLACLWLLVHKDLFLLCSLDILSVSAWRPHSRTWRIV